MTAEVWVAGAGLLVTIFLASGAVIWKLAEVKASVLGELQIHKDALDVELTAIRQAGYQEYKLLRQEINDVSAQTYREFGETVQAVREKINQVELWVRDQFGNYLLKSDFERDHDHILESLRTLNATVERRFNTLEEKLDSRNHRG
jgi:hypothetical protein